MRCRHILSILCIGLFFSAYLTACKPSAHDEPEIVHARLGDQDLYIPKEYLKFRHTSVGTESALIQAWYPGSAVAPGNDSAELWKQGVWWKNVRILINYYKDPASVEKLAESRMAHLKASYETGSEYGLIHYEQPEGSVKDHHDIWLEKQDKEILSFITCSEKLVESDFPQCRQYIKIRRTIWINATYDRRFLPEWKMIKQNIESMFESFRNEDTARDFIKSQFSKVQNVKELSGKR